MTYEMNDPLDTRCIRLDAEMEIGRVGEECIKQTPNPTNPCGLCLEYGFCFKAPVEKSYFNNDGEED